MTQTVFEKVAGTVRAKQGTNTLTLYDHQIEAMKKLNIINREDSFRTLLVLPTGGGKTLTAVLWLLRNALDRKVKILWIAHRHLLLEQALITFQKNAFSDDALIHNPGFKYRIISGNHDIPLHIKSDDDLLVASKDSIIRGLSSLDSWLKGQSEVYLVVDEAHHTTAKSYRKILDYVDQRVPNVKLLGLTATPFRTAVEEQGLLSRIFTDGVEGNRIVKGEKGIVFKIDLRKLIERGILSRPHFDSCNTDLSLGENLGLNALKSIERLDSIPDDIADHIARNSPRNNLIVQKYLEKSDEYGQTLVFAVNITHALELKAVFEKAKVPCAYVISDVRTEFTNVSVSKMDNEENIEKFRQGKIKVLINVNILTEGVDLPQTKTVFLTRPTVSKILMTQMIGRALRGEKAGGTKDSYIITFIDEWKENIAWVNPESIIFNDNDFTDENPQERNKREIRLISISKIEEFAKMMDDAIDTFNLESLDFVKRIPLGMYVFTVLIGDNGEYNHQIMVYDSTKAQYENMLEALPEIFLRQEIEDEYLSNEQLDDLCQICRNAYFFEDMIPAYDERDIRNLLIYFAQKECPPAFVPFDDIDRCKLDISVLAQHIIDEDMGQKAERSYIDNIWNEENSLIRIYFSRKTYFERQLHTEKLKLQGAFVRDEEENVTYELTDFEHMTLWKIREANPEYAREIFDAVYSKNQLADGNYCCPICGYKSLKRGLFQIDHIKPFSKGGLTNLENLQLLCIKCNRVKADYNE